MINWEELGKFGISKEMLEQSGQLDSMLKGYKTNRTMPLTLNIPGVLTAKLDARLSFISNGGQVMLGIHGIRKEPELDRPYFGHIFTEEDKKNLRESGNMGRVADLNLRGNTTEPCLISIDKNTNELVAVRQEHVYIPNEIKGITLTPDEIQKLKNGEQIFVEGMKSNQGKEFNANLQYSAERRGIEFIFPKDQAFKPADTRRCAAFPHAAQSVERRTHHPCRGYETKERRTVFFLCYHGQGYRRAPI